MKKVFRTVILFSLAIFFSVLHLSGQRMVSGKVISESSGEGIPGVNVSVRGTVTGTITNVEGEYSIQVSGPGAVLVFSFIGYHSEEVTVGERSVINIELEEEISQLDEVVVIGYGVRKKSDLTGAITQVKSEDFNEAAVPGIDQILQGRAAGVQVTNNSGMPGAGVMVTIRGMGTWNDSDPLYVIDGMPVENDISFLDPSDIETIEVLKDASAAAIYGARAANGVILITTRMGSEGKNNVSFNAYTGMQSLWRQVDVTDAAGYASVYNDIQTTFGRDPETQPWFFIHDSLTEESTNWQEELFRPARIQNYDLSFTGGNNRITYNISGDYFEQDGIMRGSDYRRISFRANTDIRINDKLTFGERFSVGSSTAHEVPRGGGNSPHLVALLGDPLSPVYRDEDDPDYDYETARWGELGYSKKPNPVGVIERMDNERLKTPLILNSFLNYEIIEGLEFRVNGGVNLLFHEYEDFTQTYYEGGFSKNELTTMNVRTWKNMSWLFESTLKYSRTIAEDHNFSALAGFSRQYSSIEDFMAKKIEFPGNDEAYRYMTFGTEIILPSDVTGTKTESAIESMFGRLHYAFRNKYLLTASVRRDGSSRFGPDSQPLFGNTPRYDYFPSAAVAWKISEESFLADNIDAISFLKLRFGWGQLGNDRTVKGNDYPWFSAVETNRNLQNYVFGGQIVTGGAIVGKAIRDIRWERSTQSNLGIDLYLFDNRFSLIADVYRKITEDQLVAVPLPWIVGVFNNPEDTKLGSDPLLNAGEVLNQGFEFIASVRNKESEFNYEFSLNFTRNYNEVLSLGTGNEIIQTGDASGGMVSITRPGDPIASFYGYVTDGLFTVEDDKDGDDFAENQPFIINERNDTLYTQRNARPGDLKFVDINGDTLLSSEDKTIIGNPHPDFTFGISFNCEFRGFDLNLFWQGVYGNDIYSTLTEDFLGGEPTTNFHRDALNAYKLTEGDNLAFIDTNVPRVDAKQKNSNFRPSDLYIQDGSYLRLKNIQLGYSIPPKIISRLGMSQFRIYLAAQNLITFTNYKYGYDPEIGRAYNNYGLAQEKFNQRSLEIGIDRGVYPQARSYMIGVNITF